LTNLCITDTLLPNDITKYKQYLETYSLYNGDVELIFDNRDDKHAYIVDGEIVYGVTSIIGVIDKPALKQWAANKAADKFRELVRPGIALDELDLANAYEQIRFAFKLYSKRALDVGTLAHNKIEEIVNAHIKGTQQPDLPIQEEAKNAVQAFIDWEKKHNVKFLHSERKIYSRKHKFAGTVDIIAEVDGQFSVLDIKTSAAVYQEYFFQTAAYSKAVEEEFGKKVERNIILRVDKNGKGVEAKENGSIDDCFEVFLACKKIYEYQMKEKNQQLNMSLAVK
jgi:hypothetical protein